MDSFFILVLQIHILMDALTFGDKVAAVIPRTIDIRANRNVAAMG